jgi:hypothetical protein
MRRVWARTVEWFTVHELLDGIIKIVLAQLRKNDRRPRDVGPADRIEVLVEVGRLLALAEAGRALWPGRGPLRPARPGQGT